MNAKTMFELLQISPFPGAVVTRPNPSTARIVIDGHVLDYAEAGYWQIDERQHESLLPRGAASPSDVHTEIRRILLVKLELEALRELPPDAEQAVNVLARRVALAKLDLIILGAQATKHWREARAAQDEVSALRKKVDSFTPTLKERIVMGSALACLGIYTDTPIDIREQAKAYAEGRREEQVMLDKAQASVRELEAALAEERARVRGLEAVMERAEEEVERLKAELDEAMEALSLERAKLAEALEGESIHVAALRQRAEAAEKALGVARGHITVLRRRVKFAEGDLVEHQDEAEAEQSIADVTEARAKLWTDMAAVLGCDPDDEQGPFLVVRSYLNRIAHLESLPGAQDLDALLRIHNAPTTFNGRELSAAERACYLIQRGQQAAWNARDEVKALRFTLDGVSAALYAAGVPYCAEQGADQAVTLEPGQRILWALPQRPKVEPKKG